jgi:hypothetical protein
MSASSDSMTIPRRGLRQVSRKRQAERPERDAVLAAVMARDGRQCRAEAVWPELECHGGLDGHELAPRSVYPGGHLDAANIVLVCRRHHDAIGDNVELAHERGLHRWSWEPR